MTAIKALRNDNDDLQTYNNGHENVTMNKYGNLNVNVKSIKGSTIDMYSGNSGDGTQRVCIANDDIPFTNVRNYIVDKRINSGYRYKICGGIGIGIDSINYYIFDNYTPTIYTRVSPPIGNVKINSLSVDDTSNGTGCRSVYLKYIDSSKDVKEDIINMQGGPLISLNPEIREIIEFKCKTFGSLNHNDGTITLYNSVLPSVTINRINLQFNNSLNYGIEIPQDGYTLLKKLTVTSLETVDLTADLEIKILLIERYISTPNYIYRTLLLCRCKYSKTIEIDLSYFPPIYGSQSSISNFAIYPVAKSLGVSTTTTQAFLTAINVD